MLRPKYTPMLVFSFQGHQPMFGTASMHALLDCATAHRRMAEVLVKESNHTTLGRW